MEEMNRFSRTEILLGKENIEKLENSHVLICGVGGVGSYVAEALTRNAVGRITIIDFDEVDITNINRQILAVESTIGKVKVDVMKDRMKSINPACEIIKINKRLDIESVNQILRNNRYNYVVDAVDTVEAKVELAKVCHELEIPFIASMGCANKIYPEKLEIAPLKKTHTCPLARAMRRALREEEINSLVCFSSEQPLVTPKDRNAPLGTVSFVPSVAGLLIAGQVVRDLTGISKKTL